MRATMDSRILRRAASLFAAWRPCGRSPASRAEASSGSNIAISGSVGHAASVLGREETERHGRTERRPGARIIPPRNRGRAVADRVEALDRLTFRGKYPRVRVGEQAALRADVTREDLQP